MDNFKLKDDILFTIDFNSIAIVNKKNKSHIFIEYPEAAVWSVLIENHKTEKSIQMLMAILGKSEADTKKFIGLCLKEWKKSGIIQ